MIRAKTPKGRFSAHFPSLPRFDVGSVLGGYLRGTNIFGTIILAVLVIFIIAALVGSVANLTTGLTLAHSSFGNATLNVKPNANVTSTPGLSPVLQLYPLFFVFIGLIFLAKHFGENGVRGI